MTVCVWLCAERVESGESVEDLSQICGSVGHYLGLNCGKCWTFHCLLLSLLKMLKEMLS